MLLLHTYYFTTYSLYLHVKPIVRTVLIRVIYTTLCGDARNLNYIATTGKYLCVNHQRNKVKMCLLKIMHS